MASSLTDLFASMKQSLEQDRDVLNDLDGEGVGDGDAGDNMVANFETITNALRQAESRGVGPDQALTFASQVLQEQGKGATAPVYASGLRQAASNLEGKTSFGLDDIGGLLSGLLGGAQQAQQGRRGDFGRGGHAVHPCAGSGRSGCDALATA